MSYCFGFFTKDIYYKINECPHNLCLNERKLFCKYCFNANAIFMEKYLRQYLNKYNDFEFKMNPIENKNCIINEAMIQFKIDLTNKSFIIFYIIKYMIINFNFNSRPIADKIMSYAYNPISNAYGDLESFPLEDWSLEKKFYLKHLCHRAFPIFERHKNINFHDSFNKIYCRAEDCRNFAKKFRNFCSPCGDYD